MPHRALLFAATLGVVLGAASARAFTPVYHPELTVQRTPSAIVVDGDLGDPGWRYAGRADNFAEHNPGDQVEPPVATEAWLTYDDTYLYAAFVCHDDPTELRASFTERDRIWSDDYVILCLDTFGKQAQAYEIAANPYGIQGDLLWSLNGDEDLTYDLVFATASRITADGWQVEMAIPWNSLRFPDTTDQVWRVDFWRNRPREVREQYSWAAYDRDEPCWPCKWGTVRGISGVQPGRGLAVLPSVVTTQASHRQDDGAFDHGAVTAQAGLSVRDNLSSTLSAEATLNPDFSQVESDAAQIDVNSTFALYYSEKRPFFQEGSDLFASWFTTVYTRTINDPLFAAKLVGRPGADNLAVLVARDEHSPFILPFAERSVFVAGRKSTSTLARYQHSLGDGSHVGLVITDRRHDDGGSGSLMGVDWRQRLDRNWQIEVQALATHTAEPNDTTLTAGINDLTFDRGAHTAAFDGERFWGHGLYASLERSARHWDFDFDYWRRSPTFRAENGFEPRNDRHETSVWTGYTFYTDGFVDRVQPQINVARVWNFAGTKKDEWIDPHLYLRLAWAQTQINLDVLYSNELFHDIQFDDIWQASINIEAKPSSAVSGGINLAHGHRIARTALVLGRQNSTSLWLNLKPWDRLILESSYDFTRSVDRGTGEALFSGWVARTRLGMQLTRELSLRLVLQYDDFDRLWEVDPLITYRINPFSIFYVGSTRDYRGYGETELPQPGWRLSERSYFLKLQYLFQV